MRPRGELRVAAIGGECAENLDPHFLRNVRRLIRISHNLGDAKSLIVHPATTTHQRFTPQARAEMGIGDGLLRLSVGLEHPADLCEDLARGFKAL